MMTVHAGGCHCGAVRFEIEAEIDRIVECNCSICAKKGILHVAVEDAHFRLLTGADDLSLYRFGSEEASHWFCRHCGIHAFGRPRNDPSRYTVNARCLDDVDTIMARAEAHRFDGKNHPKDRAAT